MLYKKFQCPDNIFEPKKLLNYYNSKLLEFGHSKALETYGDILSTVGDKNNHLFLGLNVLCPKLMKWINDCKMEYCKEVFKDKPFKLVFNRFWINSMNPNAEVKVHTHQPECIVLVFYLNASNNSGDLVLVDYPFSLGKELKLLNEYPEHTKIHIPVNTGDLVIHRGLTPQGVSAWKGSTPRISIIVQYGINWI